MLESSSDTVAVGAEEEQPARAKRPILHCPAPGAHQAHLGRHWEVLHSAQTNCAPATGTVIPQSRQGQIGDAGCHHAAGVLHLQVALPEAIRSSRCCKGG